MRLNRLGLVAICLIFALVTAGCSHQQPHTMQALAYPDTKKVGQVDDYHGTRVPDPYRWLEDLDGAETAAWVQAQNEVTFGYLEQIPGRQRVKARLTELWNHEKYGIPYKEGGRYFFSKNDGLQNQSVLYTTDALDAEPRVLLDPNQLSKDGTVALSGRAISRDGRTLAYGLSTAGSDWQEYFVRDVETGKDLSDHIRWIKFARVSWTQSGSGFFYGRFDEPEEGDTFEDSNYYHKLYFHRLGTDQSDDKLVCDRPDQKDWIFDGRVTDDGFYLIITVSKGTETNNAVFYKSLAVKDAPIVEMLNQFDAEYTFIDNDGPVFWFRTNADAPRGRVVAVDLRNPAKQRWREIIPQAEETLRGVDLVGNRFVASYLQDARTVVRMYSYEGKLVREVELPGLGSAYGFYGKRRDKETFFSFTNYGTPSTIYRYDLATDKSTVFRRPDVPFNPDDYVTKQIFYHSKDGTRVPMFITHKKGLELDGNNPTYLYGYGGFNISITPRFSVSNLVWMEMGGVYAMANLRGGGEYGKAWHDAGKKLRKQNVFDDFIAAARWLIDNDYTQPEKLAISGASNGGLLVGACMTQRPDLFRACLPAVGVLDMLRFNKFTIGHAWVSDYGSPEDPEEFKALYAYSPLHNLTKGTHYPATMITTADHDDRVVPSHSFKFAAALQEAHAGPAPVLIRIDTKAGHGAGKPTLKRIEEAADKLAFLAYELGMQVPADQN